MTCEHTVSVILIAEDTGFNKSAGNSLENHGIYLVCSKYHRHKEECALHTVKSCTCRKLLGSNIETQADRKAFVAHLTAKQSGQMKRELMTKQKEMVQIKNGLQRVST